MYTSIFDEIENYKDTKDVKFIPKRNVPKSMASQPADTESFNMITPLVAIGNINSSYEPFTTIVNLAYPTNGVSHSEIKITMENGKRIIRVGIFDDPSESMLSVLNMIIPELLKTPEQLILFHCHAGISRSSSLAIAYLSLLNNISFEKSYKLAKDKRPIVNPNPGFKKDVMQFIQSKLK